MFIGSYWSEREESKESAAERIAAFWADLASCDDAFACWYSRGASRAAALRSPMKLDAASLVSHLMPNRRDAGRQPISDLGSSLGAWNGRDVSFSATIGCWNEHVGNAVVLDLGAEAEIGESSYRRVIAAIVNAFDPDHAVVTSHDYLGRADATKPWEAGLFTYRRGGGIEQHTFAHRFHREGL